MSLMDSNCGCLFGSPVVCHNATTSSSTPAFKNQVMPHLVHMSTSDASLVFAEALTAVIISRLYPDWFWLRTQGHSVVTTYKSRGSPVHTENRNTQAKYKYM